MLLDKLFSIQLTLIGVTFSIFTILYSIILGKFDQLKIIAKQIKRGNTSPEIKQSEKFCLDTIFQLKKIIAVR